MAVHVFCAFPGMIRGGRPNPRVASYPEGEHSAAQLQELLDDPDIDVIVGGEFMDAGYVAGVRQAEGKAEAKKAKG